MISHTIETDDGEAFVTVTEGTAEITITHGRMRGVAKAGDFQRGTVRRLLAGVTE